MHALRALLLAMLVLHWTESTLHCHAMPLNASAAARERKSDTVYRDPIHHLRCTRSGNTITVVGLPENVGCVMRTDTYLEEVPRQHMASFTGVSSSSVGVELYTTRVGPQDCVGFLQSVACGR